MYDDNLRVVEFTALDRCDGCPAQALVMAEHPEADSELKFCGHHIKRLRNALIAEGWELSYDTEALEDLYHPVNA